MASSYAPGHGAPHVVPSATAPNFAPSDLQSPQSQQHFLPHLSPSDSDLPPEPSDLSAAAILATLADSSRPPTSHGEYDDDLDDNLPGGISLIADGPDDPFMQPAAMPAPGNFAFAHIGDGMQPPYSDTAFDFAAPLGVDAVTPGQLPLPPTIAELFAWTQYATGAEFAPLNPSPIPDHQAFLNITPFFKHFVAQPKAVSLGLDVADVPEVVTRQDLQGDRCDFQGIDWAMRYTTRAIFRERRVAFESQRLHPRARARRQACGILGDSATGINHVPQWHMPTPNTDDYFAFRRNNTAHKAWFPHFQLRNVLATPSRNDIYYAVHGKVMRTDAEGSPATPVIDMTKRLVSGNYPQITTLDATDKVLFAGGFDGDYAITDLTSTQENSHTWGRIRDAAHDAQSWITNHVHLSSSRHTYTPQAIVCSNDSQLRTLDCTTNTFLNTTAYPKAVNCSATSPNGRLRIVVGDFHETLITNAETGAPIESLTAHTEDAFACAWADDGIHLATAAQDSAIVIWDARRWDRPLATLFSELAIPRSLRFSPVGSGPRVLVAAEADDYVNIINAQTFASKQVFDFFGPIAGVSMPPDGQSLFVANAEKSFGGMIELERDSWTGRKRKRRGRSRWGDEYEDLIQDWESEERMEEDERVVCGAGARERRGIDLAALDV